MCLRIIRAGIQAVDVGRGGGGPFPGPLSSMTMRELSSPGHQNIQACHCTEPVSSRSSKSSPGSTFFVKGADDECRPSKGALYLTLEPLG